MATPIINSTLCFLGWSSLILAEDCLAPECRGILTRSHRLTRKTAAPKVEKALHDRVIRGPKLFRTPLHDDSPLKDPIAFASEHNCSVRYPEEARDIVRYNHRGGAD